MSYRVGAVAYHPRVVTIWEDFRRWFAEHRLPLEYTLYATYEAQVDARRRNFTTRSIATPASLALRASHAQACYRAHRSRGATATRRFTSGVG